MKGIIIVVAIATFLGMLAYYAIPLFTKLFQLSKRGQQITNSKKVVCEMYSENKLVSLSDFANHLDEKGSAYFR